MTERKIELPKVAMCHEHEWLDFDGTMCPYCKLLADKGVLEATISMAVARLGGTVEGRPTGTRNFLQRIDELVAKEAKIADMEALLRDRHSGRYKDGHLWNCPRSLTGADCYCGFEEFCKCVDALLAEGLW